MSLEAIDLSSDKEIAENLRRLSVPEPTIKELVPLVKYAALHIRALAASREINPQAVLNILGHLRQAYHIRKEARAVGCTMIIGKIELLDTCLPVRSLVQPPIVTHDDLTPLIPYYDCVNEDDYAFVFNPDGALQSLRQLMTVGGGHQLTGLDLLPYITENSDALAFSVRKEKRSIRLYANGTLDTVILLSEKEGTWEFKRFSNSIAKISKASGIPDKTISRVLDIAIEMMQLGYGALFVVGDPKDTSGFGKPSITIKQTSLAFVDSRSVIDLAKQDGATCITSSCEIAKTNFLIHNKIAQEDIPEAYRGGARHATAWATSRE